MMMIMLENEERDRIRESESGSGCEVTAFAIVLQCPILDLSHHSLQTLQHLVVLIFFRNLAAHLLHHQLISLAFVAHMCIAFSYAKHAHFVSTLANSAFICQHL